MYCTLLPEYAAENFQWAVKKLLLSPSRWGTQILPAEYIDFDVVQHYVVRVHTEYRLQFRSTLRHTEYRLNVDWYIVRLRFGNVIFFRGNFISSFDQAWKADSRKIINKLCINQPKDYRIWLSYRMFNEHYRTKIFLSKFVLKTKFKMMKNG